MSSDKEELENIKKKVLREVQLSDLYHLMFLKPFECTLDQNKGGLPSGLKIVKRTTQLQYQQIPIKQILSSEQFYSKTEKQIKQMQEKDRQPGENSLRDYSTYIKYCRHNHADNLLCQMKLGKEMEMAICVCMYNEDKDMLNNTLQGIGENIVQLYKQGVDPDKIVVIIVQDGIEKMDKSILPFVEVMEAESGIMFGEGQRKMENTIRQIQETEKKREVYNWDGEDSLLNLNCFLFDKQNEEEELRKSLRLVNVKKEYDQIKDLLKKLQQLQKKKNLTHEDLPHRILRKFKLQCMKYKNGEADQNATQQLLNKFFQQVIQNLNQSRPLMHNVITKQKEYCKQYIEGRQNMSHVSFFRTSQFFPEDSGYSTAEQDHRKALRSRTKLNTSLNERDRLLQNRSSQQDDQRDFSIKMNIFFVVKYKNAQKLSSHNWFFNGFCKEFSNCSVKKENNRSRTELEVVSPKYTILLDVGLRPQASALCKMYYTLENHREDIGGVCGYMGLKLQRTGEDQQKVTENLDFFTKIFLNFVDIQRAQQLEYHFAHLIDKGFESIFRFIHVLPGAFSGYNMKAIWGRDPQATDRLLQNYFKSIGQKVGNQKFQQDQLGFCNILLRVLVPDALLKKCSSKKQTYEKLMYESNVYLAQDRILCMGIHKNGYDLMFLPDAYSFVDPVKDIPSLMGQRKRWINGSYFAFEKVSDEFAQMRCCQVLNIQIWYLALMNMLAFIAPGFFLFSISVAMQAFKADVLVRFFQDTLQPDSEIYNAFVYTINFIYAMLIFGLIFFSLNLTNRDKKFVRFVYGVSTILGIMSIIMLVILLVDLARGLGRESSYLIANQSKTFIDDIPGGQSTVDIIRYIMLGILGLYALPLMLYSLCFRNIRVIFEVIAGAISFAFYTPTYLIILNIYALCRMDDLSWGTKGLQTGGNSAQAKVQNAWKIIRTIHVGKLVFWNVLTAGLLIHFGSNYLVRFYLTFALMVIIAVTMSFKVLCGVIYYFYYLIGIRSSKIVKREGQQSQQSIRYMDPSLYSALKFQHTNKRPGKSQMSMKSINERKQNDDKFVSIESELRQHIQQNIEYLNKMSGGMKPNLMALQIVGSLINPKEVNPQTINFATSAINSMIQQSQRKATLRPTGLHQSKFHKHFNQKKAQVLEPISPQKIGKDSPVISSSSQQKFIEQPKEEQGSILDKAKNLFNFGGNEGGLPPIQNKGGMDPNKFKNKFKK